MTNQAKENKVFQTSSSDSLFCSVFELWQGLGFHGVPRRHNRLPKVFLKTEHRYFFEQCTNLS